ncbi:MAG: hypothetical protein FJW22_14045 [Acidimicrobiia bacterium]|nr:hypothetical protein [Acidimicrobiia bacterium]
MRSVIAVLLAVLDICLAGQSPAFFVTGQPADLMLSGYGFNRTGGALRFNHPGGIAVVSGQLVLADRNNNRVLIWSGLPSTGDEPPAIVLGQGSFDTNAPGTRLDELNWPTAVATDGARLYVADTYNDRILVWRSVPTFHKQPADFAITRASGVVWPWGIWTDGRRLMTSTTVGGRVLLWHRIPDDDRPPDVTMRAPAFGTPRTIESDGTRLLVSDHNARTTNGPGTFFWRTFPVGETQPHDFFMSTAPDGRAQPPGGSPSVGEHIHDAELLADGRLLALFNRTLCVWSRFPESTGDACAVTIGSSRPGETGIDIDAGDNSGLAVANGRLFVSVNNGNRVLVWNRVPTDASTPPAFAIGSPDVRTNTLVTDGIITNGIPQTDGERLYVSSDYDRTLHVWRSRPVADRQQADVVYQLPFGPWASTRVGAGLALAGQSTVMVWRSPPDGQPADLRYERAIGPVALDDLRGVAFDGTYFYLASQSRGRVWAWRGLPSADAAPAAELVVDLPGRMSSDGRYLAAVVGSPGGGVRMFDVARITSGDPAPVSVGQGLRMNLPQGVTLAGGGLFIPDTNGNRVLAWRDAFDAYHGRPPDAVLGAPDLNPQPPRIGQSTLFWPGTVAYDGQHLWVGEFKFSNRIVRFVRP